MLSAAIFDLDGTLIDSLQDLADSMNEALAALAFPEHDLDAYRYFIGDGVHSLIARALPPGAREDAPTIQRATELYRTAYGSNWSRATAPYAGIMALLDELRSVGIPLAVLSNKPQHFTALCVEHFFPQQPFTVVLGQRDHVPRKPDPAGAWEIASTLQLPPEQIAFIGDTSTDIRTGLAAGMRTVGVTWGFRPPQELEEAGAATIVHRPGDISTLFRK